MCFWNVLLLLIYSATLLGLPIMKRERISKCGLHGQTDLVGLWTSHYYIVRTFWFLHTYRRNMTAYEHRRIGGLPQKDVYTNSLIKSITLLFPMGQAQYCFAQTPPDKRRTDANLRVSFLRRFRHAPLSESNNYWVLFSLLVLSHIHFRIFSIICTDGIEWLIDRILLCIENEWMKTERGGLIDLGYNLNVHWTWPWRRRKRTM